MSDCWSSATPASHEQGNDDDARPPKRRKETHLPSATRLREVGLMRDGMGLSSASFVGSASGIHFIRSVQGALSGPAVSARAPGSNLVPGEDDRLHSDPANGGQKPLWQPHEVGHEEEVDPGRAFTFNELVDWTSSYFDVWHPCFPFLHAPSTLESFENLAKQGILQQPMHDLTIIRALVSISIADRRQSNQILPRPPPRYLAFSSFDDALESIAFALAKPATIPRLQAVLCVQLFLVSMLRLNGAARIGGLVNGLAFQLGLHRCPARYPTFSTTERQLRQRLFWSIYCIERHVCQALGLPLTIQDDDVDVCYPDKELHHLPENATHPKDRPDIFQDKDTDDSDDRLKLLSLLARHAQIKGSIMELRNKNIPSRDETIDKAVIVDARLTRWWNEVQDVFEQVDAEEIAMSNIHRVILTISKHESKIILNRPLLTATKDTPNYTGALHSCILNSKSVLSTLQRLLAPTSSRQNGPNSQDVSLPMCWPSWTWAVWMSAFVIMFAASEDEVPAQVANRLMDRSLDLLDKLAVRGSVWPNACAVAIKDLRVALMQRLKRPISSSNTAKFDRLEEAKHRQQIVPGRINGIGTSGDRGIHQSSEMDYQTSPTRSQPSTTPIYQTPQTGTGPAPSPNFAGRQPEGIPISQDLPTPAQYQNFVQNGQMQGMPNQFNPFMQQAFDLTSSVGFGDTGASRALWTDLELGASLPVDVPAYHFNGMADPFQGFDIPFWLGQDNYAGWLSENV